MEVTQLIDDLLSDQLDAKLNSIEHLKQISSALGKNKVQKDLLPFLHEILDEEDNVVLALLN